ncbi:hypothetical protein Ciccas_000027 [Cichlidogyrus casuarinus]|uniref:Uncharacterized protein n=1 Tax=Cichlidogyrus casuarinus TaxID=1844966 RepID=A0ABD2QP31_9PLAT
MHSAYYSVKPTANKYLQSKWDEKDFDGHIKRIHKHLEVILKLVEERHHTIEKENRMLVEKMTRIMRTAGGIDNINNYVPKSLNLRKRQLDHLQIFRENKGIVERMLEQRKSQKNTHEDFGIRSWKECWKDTLKYMDNISKFPMHWWKVNACLLTICPNFEEITPPPSKSGL